ncbi:organ-specific protein S2-like [Hibiscus syriacus]|uniref:Organ-specific protein S2-like n=1 Tax=Hibiscus syriacus TaxID=106335 RepID=A0A6A3B4L3_HIBSY|nr:SWI/SNF complex subunit SWI3D-like [Hibiscus syriacus]KAE8711726.1 organ-specific protein S2-like [Hibiscus syriacus]
MEEKRRDAANSPAGESSAEPDSTSTRRRGGALKRKGNWLSGSSSSSTPSKRVTREKSNLISHPPVNHYGPLTRARQGAPGGNFALGSSSGSDGAKLEASTVKQSVKAEDLEELNKLSEEWEALEAKTEADFEAIRSRDSNAHVVPNHCGWFSWTKIHHLEESILPSFFNGKFPNHTPNLYMEIRNWIMKKFHANPSREIELKDLEDLEVGDLDARQEVLEFLDYWGLINFHPFPPICSAVCNDDGDGMAKKDSLLEKLFHFEEIESRPQVVTRTNVSTPSVPSGFLPESALTEDLMTPEEPSVEYHCNSCSADCSRKRYHCQKQADFDLCTDCFNDGKFGSDMSSSDFILMEPAGAGLSGGKWTDQETLLLLEALELYKENWNEIAEHVATKTKAQCILHFVQMPIEDVFFNKDDDIDTNSKETAGPAASSDETSVPKDVLETTESKTALQEDQAQTTPTETSKPEDGKEVRASEEMSKPETVTDVNGGQETSKPEETNVAKDGKDTTENCALVALREAFEAIGYNLTSEGTLSFADVGNPVMALAGFFARLVGPNIAAVSAQSSLKLLSGSCPNLQLASRNCFILEDPPDDKKEPTCSESVVNDTGNGDAQNVKNSEDKSLEGDQKSSLSKHGDENTEVSLPEEKVTSPSANDLTMDKKESSNIATNEEDNKANLNESTIINQSKDHQPSVTTVSNNSTSQFLPNSLEKRGGKETEKEPSAPPKTVKGVDMSDSVPVEKNELCDAAGLKPGGEPSEPENASENLETASSYPSGAKNEQKPVQPSADGESTKPAEASNDVEMASVSQPAEKTESRQPVASNSVNEKGATTDKSKEGKNKNHDSTGREDNSSIDRVKRAAVTALSAAAVKAKLLADQEEDQIRQLTASLIEKQLHKLEAKLAFFNEMEGVVMRVKEQLDRSRQRLYHERSQIIAARLGLPASSSRAMPPPNATNRVAANFANSVSRPPMSLKAPRPPMSRPMGPVTPTPSNPYVSTTVAGSSIRPSNKDNLSSIGIK